MLRSTNLVIQRTVQAGRVYLKLCGELRQPPHQEIFPVVHLTLHGASCSSSAAADTVANRNEARIVAPSRTSAPAALQQAKPLKAPPEDLFVMVMCNNVTGRLHPASCRVEANGREMSATQFEQFAGCASAKKWRASLKVVPGSCPECPEGAGGVVLQRYCVHRAYWCEHRI